MICFEPVVLLYSKIVILLLQNLPKENLIIAGDFNINLFSFLASEFEEMMFINNLIPTVSQATHKRPGCKPSLIDNILKNYLTEKFSEASFNYNSQANFCNFIEIIHDTIYSSCKVDDNIMIKSKRNRL